MSEIILKTERVHKLLLGLTGTGACPFPVIVYGKNMVLTGELRWIGGTWGLWVGEGSHLEFTSGDVVRVQLHDCGQLSIQL